MGTSGFDLLDKAVSTWRSIVESLKRNRDESVAELRGVAKTPGEAEFSEQLVDGQFRLAEAALTSLVSLGQDLKRVLDPKPAEAIAGIAAGHVMEAYLAGGILSGQDGSQADREERALKEFAELARNLLVEVRREHAQAVEAARRNGEFFLQDLQVVSPDLSVQSPEPTLATDSQDFNQAFEVIMRNTAESLSLLRDNLATSYKAHPKVIEASLDSLVRLIQDPLEDLAGGHLKRLKVRYDRYRELANYGPQAMASVLGVVFQEAAGLESAVSLLGALVSREVSQRVDSRETLSRSFYRMIALQFAPLFLLPFAACVLGRIQLAFALEVAAFRRLRGGDR